MTLRLFAVFLLLAPLATSESPVKIDAYVAQEGTVRPDVECKGTFVPAAAAELALDFAVYRGEARLLEIAEHGRYVNKGDVVARFDTKAIDRQLVGEKMGLARTELGLRHLRAKQAHDAQKAAETLARTERDVARARTRLKVYREHERPLEKESERIGLQTRDHRLDDQKDELQQLRKMYGDDELVDATEEIVIKRQERNFARSLANDKIARRRIAYRNEFYDSWREEDIVRDVAAKEAGLARLKESQAMAAERRRLDLHKAEFDLEQARDKLARLGADRAQFVQRAARAGLFLHGAADGAPFHKEQRVGANVRSRAAFATIADAKRVAVVVDVGEAAALGLQPGAAVKVVPNARKKTELIGAMRVAALPKKPGVFEARVELSKPEVAFRPGMTCVVKLPGEAKKHAVVIPRQAVEHRDGKPGVRCAKSAQGPFEWRPVKLGAGDDNLVAITSGVVANEVVALP